MRSLTLPGVRPVVPLSARATVDFNLYQPGPAIVVSPLSPDGPAHLWAVTARFRVRPEAAEVTPQWWDADALLDVSWPACTRCQEPYDPQASPACPGAPS